MGDILLIWSSRGSFDDGQVERVQSWIANIPCCRDGYHMNYIKVMPSEFDNMSDYINMWSAVMINEQCDDLSELARDPTTWVAQSTPEESIVDLDDGPDAVTHRLTLKSDKYALNSPTVITLSRRYYVGSFTAKEETPLREWDIVVLRSYMNDILNIQQSTYLCVLKSKTYTDGSEIG